MSNNQSNQKTDDKPHLLLLEDNKDLLEQTMAEAQKCDWDVTSANHVESALQEIRRIRTAGRRLDLLFVDIMVPLRKEAWERLAELLVKREELVDQASDGGVNLNLSPDVLTTLRVRLREIDLQIRGQIEMDGGLQFLESCLKENVLQNCKIVLFTARNKDSDDLKIRMQDFQVIKYLQKPTPIQVVRSLLKDFPRTTTV